jgi:DNA-binding Lrp family transcriptional regulator
MEATHPFPSASAGQNPPWWRIGRASIGFLLDIMGMGRGSGDVIDPLILSVVLEANVAPINQDLELSARYATLEDVVPEALRRPVTINALAASLQLPYETVRRRCARMTESGALVSTPRGVYVPGLSINNPFYLITATARYERLKAFYFELKALGAMESATLRPNDVPSYRAAPIRAANRLVSEYVLRVVETVMRGVGDPLSGLILMEMGRANAAHLDAIDLQVEGPIPDSRRKPVSMLELSRRVGLPAETVRRHVKTLEAEGLCRAVKGGRLAAVEKLMRGDPERGGGLAENLQNLQRLFAKCATLGIIAHWETEAAG